VQLTATLVKTTMQGDTEQAELRDSSLHLRNVHQDGVDVLTFFEHLRACNFTPRQGSLLKTLLWQAEDNLFACAFLCSFSCL